MQLVQVLRESAQKNPNKTAYIWRDVPMTYAEMQARTNQMANRLAELGVQKGDRVGLLMPNIPDFAVTYYGALSLGASVVPLNVMYRAREIAYILNDSGAKVLVTVQPFLPQVLEARPSLTSVKHIINKGLEQVPDVLNLDLLLNDASEKPAEAEVSEEDIAVICYTSGTTGNPKGAMLTHGNLLANLDQMLRLPRFDTTPDDIGIQVLPLFHIYGMNVGMNLGTLMGMTGVMVERFDAEMAAQAIHKYRCTTFVGAPPMFIAMVNLPNVREYDLTSLKTVVSGAAALPVRVLEMFKELTGVEIMEGYGLTETSPVLTTNAAGLVTKPGSVGPAIPDVEIRLVDENDNDVPLGQPGELIARGPNVFKGYYNMPEATAEAFKGGWFHTGDIATKDEDGYYYIVDRKKEMINVSGFNVYPREIEEVLYRHPKVLDAAVIGVPDQYQGESVMAILALKPGQTVTNEEIIEYCRTQLAAFKVPRHIQFREALPKLPTGKVLKRELRDEVHKNWPKQ